MSSEVVISVKNMGKSYHIYNQPRDRLKQFLFRGKRQYFREFWALKDVNLDIKQGEVLGVIGRNGAGKSTLLQLLCGTLAPTHGEVVVKGRVAALLELGAGFNPEFTGRENVFMSAAILGLSKQEVESKFNEIVDFSGIRGFIDQPVSTYSSGMYVRLAFSVAINVNPDILVIDEALSVGDGAFARKSFDRIMDLKRQGKTIIFCSHSLYHIEAICNRAIWLKDGHINMFADPGFVTTCYENFLSEKESIPNTSHFDSLPFTSEETAINARITDVQFYCDGVADNPLNAQSLKSTISIKVCFSSTLGTPPPSVAISIVSTNGTVVASSGSHNDNVILKRSADGTGFAQLTLPKISLLKGGYFFNIFLLCENGLHLYDSAEGVTELKVCQDGLERGVVALPHHWES